MRARSLLVLAFVLAGCEALFPIHEMAGSGGGGGHASTGSTGGAPTGSGASGGGGSGSGAGPASGGGGSTSSGSGGGVCDSGVTPTHFCDGVSPSDFCSDWDGDAGTLQTPGWNPLNQVGTLTTPALDTSISMSKTGSFRVDGMAMPLSGSCSTDEAATRLGHGISSSAAGVEIDFWHRRTGGLPASGSVSDLNINCGSTYGIVNWGMRPDSYGVSVYGTGGMESDHKDTIKKLPVDQWVRVHVKVMFGHQGSVVIDHDCTNVYTASPIDTNCVSSTAKTVLFGMLTCTEVPAASVWFDDVVIKEL